MFLVYGTAGLALAGLIYGITLIGCRKPQEPVWISDFLVGNIYVPIMVALAVLGTACFLKFFLTIGSQSMGWKELGLVIAIAAVSLLLLKRLRIKQHLAEYETMRKSAAIIKPAVFRQEERKSAEAEPPVKPTSGKMAA
ncbi:MAG: hypothetical protein JSW39_30560 [Desulfobacterales bacterium]|nr:MAG: hypothetical protein JSW39_30560 [Desulfobacterales bacterium]